MKREYFAMLFFVLLLSVYFLSVYVSGAETTHENITRFIVVWLIIAFTAGQYSMRYPKRF